MPPPPFLMEELVEEILLRVPPADPATLVRAAFVCRPWRRLVSSVDFRRRFREFHRTPPMLGFLCNNYGNRRTHRGPYLSRFVPTSSFRAPAHDEWHALDARHGRVLLRRSIMRDLGLTNLLVWDPITDEQWNLPKGPYYRCWNVAVLCARTGACDHLDCGARPFIVVSLGIGYHRMSLCVYSSEDGSWSKPAYVALVDADNYVDEEPTALAGNNVYFQIDCGTRIIGYDLATRKTSVVHLPPKHEDSKTTLITVEDGGLGVAILQVDETAKLSLWSMEASPNGEMGWTKFRVIELEKLLSVDARSINYHMVGFAHDVGVFIVETHDGLFSFHRRSRRVRKVCEVQAKECNDRGICSVVPYTSFCTPALGAFSTGN